MTNINAVKILLVEDDEGDAALTKIAFKNAKIANELEVAYDAETAIKILNKEGQFKSSHSPDMILVDINLPNASGFDFLKNVKNNPEFKTTPVIMLTSSDDHKDLIKAYDLNANSYIVKPVDMEKFHDVIRAIESFWFSVVKFPNRN